MIGKIGLTGQSNCEKIAAFDMDWTLIKTKTGKVFPRNEFDWQLWHEKVQPKLRRLHASGFRVVVFTNQGGVYTKKRTLAQLKTQFCAIQKKLGIPMTFLAACGGGNDKFRKPSPAMWRYFCETLNGELCIDKEESFYCGDAAGRPATGTRKKDHSADDKTYAQTIGLTFHTPESLFLGESEALSTVPV